MRFQERPIAGVAGRPWPPSHSCYPRFTTFPMAASVPSAEIKFPISYGCPLLRPPASLSRNPVGITCPPGLNPLKGRWDAGFSTTIPIGRKTNRTSPFGSRSWTVTTSSCKGQAAPPRNTTPFCGRPFAAILRNRYALRNGLRLTRLHQVHHVIHRLCRKPSFRCQPHLQLRSKGGPRSPSYRGCRQHHNGRPGTSGGPPQPSHR